MWWLSELGWAGLEDGLGWPPCRFVLGFLSEPRIARIAQMGYDAAPPFCSYAPIGLGTSPLFRTWLGGGGVCV